MFKVLLGIIAHFICLLGMHSMLLSLFVIENITQNVAFMIDRFRRLSLGEQQEPRELTEANELNLERINRADILKLKIGNVTYFITKNVMQSILLAFHSLNIIEMMNENFDALDTSESAIYPMHKLIIFFYVRN